MVRLGDRDAVDGDCGGLSRPAPGSDTASKALRCDAKNTGWLSFMGVELFVVEGCDDMRAGICDVTRRAERELVRNGNGR